MPPLPIWQCYHVTADTRTPYHVACAPAGPRHRQRAEQQSPPGRHHHRRLVRRRRRRGRVRRLPTPTTRTSCTPANIGGIITRYDHRTGQSRNVSAYPDQPERARRRGCQYRFQWTAPILISPHDPNVSTTAATCSSAPPTAARPGTAISGDLTRERQEQAAVGRRADHRRQHRRRGLLHHLRPRRVAASRGCSGSAATTGWFT